MKKWILCLICCLILFGCNNEKIPVEQVPLDSPTNELNDEATDAQGGQPSSEPNSFGTLTDKFIYDLSVNGWEFTEGDPIILESAITYSGNLDAVTIEFTGSPFVYSIRETNRGITIPSPIAEPIRQIELKRNEPYKETYVVAGSYSETDSEELIAFVKEFLEKGFINGDYVVKGEARFSLDGAIYDEPLKGRIRFQVE